MILEVNMSPNDDNPEEMKKAKKKYLWFGYGSYGGYGSIGDSNAFQPVNIRADPSIFDKLFEIFGVKEKSKKESEEDKK
jgi:hypothetical protein